MTLSIRNRQRLRRVHTPLLRRITRSLLQDFCGVESYELCIHLVAAPEMARINEQFLQHNGSTDVITFDHDPGSAGVPAGEFQLKATATRRRGRQRSQERQRVLHGEIFLCLDDAIKQARQFRCAWQSEVVRYVIHGILHLLGHDDLKSVARKKMKREENRLLRELSRRFRIADLARPSPRRVNRKS